MELTEAQAARLARLYESAEAEILREYNKALLKGNDMKNLAALKRNVGIIRQDLLKGGRTWCEQAIPLIYNKVLAEIDAGPAGKSVLLSGFGGVHQQAVQVLAENAYQRLQDVDLVIGRRTDDIYRHLALEIVRGDAIGYQTWKQAAKTYRERLAEKGVTGFRDAAGRDWNMTTYTEMVAHTTTRETMVQGTANRLLEHGHDLAKITGGVSARTCERCKPWVGRVVSLTGRTKGYPTLDEARASGLLHPRCTHGISSAMTFDEEIAKLEGQKSKSEGRTPKEIRIIDASPEDFIKARDELPKALKAFLTPYKADEYRANSVRLRLCENEDGGYGLKGDELISVFSKPGKHLGSQLVDDAIANGAKRLDCLGDSLLEFYSKKGFKVVKTDKWDDKYAPDGWDYERFKRPNIYYMELK